MLVRRLAIALIAVSLPVAACDDDDSSNANDTQVADTTPADTTPADTTPADTTPADTTPADTTPADTTPADTTPADTTPADTTPADTTPADTTAADTTPPASCSEISSTECFSNYDCSNTSDRCESVGEFVGEVVCCVPGARGAGAVGTACTLESDCATAICIDDFCSDICDDVDDCPVGMKDCKTVLFSGSDDKWCFPDSE